MSSVMALERDPIPKTVLCKWQRAMNLLTDIIGVGAGLITRARPDQMEILVTNQCQHNPFAPGLKDRKPGWFCETVMRLKSKLHVPDCRRGAEWNATDEGVNGFLSYLGLPLRDPEGHVFGTICVMDRSAHSFPENCQDLLEQFRDMLEMDLRFTAEQRARAQEGALRLQKMEEVDALRRELMANVSHDLRTPLASLKGYIETLLMLDEQLDPADRRRYLGIAERNCDRLVRLVDELMEVSQLDSNAVKLNKEPFSLCELGYDAIAKFALQAERRGIDLRFEGRCQAPLIEADIGLIERVIDNLLSNALRHTPSGGSVTVAVEHGELHAHFEVRDTGCGIGADELPFVFDRYYRSKAKPCGGGGSAGLGLAISKRIVELHAGRIEVLSQVSAGTTVSFDLPILPAVPAR